MTNLRDSIGAFRKPTAQIICNATTASTQYLVKGSGPQSLTTYEEKASAGLADEGAGIISYFWVRFDDSLSPCPVWFLGIRPKELVAVMSCFCSLRDIWLWGSVDGGRD